MSKTFFKRFRTELWNIERHRKNIGTVLPEFFVQLFPACGASLPDAAEGNDQHEHK